MISLSRPSIGEAEIEAVADVLRSGWLSTGDVVRKFEEAVAALCRCKYAVACMSGTDALYLALRAQDIGPYDEVIVPSMTFCATVNAVVRTGAMPVFADIDAGTLCLSASSVARALCQGMQVKAVMPVHFGGAPCDVAGALTEFGRDAFLLADGAHALGARAFGGPVARLADATVFSFHPTKNITTGEGGMIVTDDPELAAKVRRLRFHGLDEIRQVVEVGVKSNMPDVLAAIGLAQLPRLQKMNGRRRLRADRYARLLAHVDGVVVPRGPSFNHVHARHLMSVLVDFGLYGLTRKDVVARMASRGVEVGVHYVAVHQHPYYVALYERLHMGVQLPVTEMVSERILSLPLYPDMHDFDVDVVVDAFIEVLRG